jgi:hypothetical protein
MSRLVIIPKAEAKTLVKRTLALGDFLAELYVDNKSDPPLYHYIITRKDSADIIAWGQEATSEIAEREALDKIASLSHRAAKVG